MHDSYSEINLPFATQPALFQDYVNPSGGLRTGKLLEHLDALAGSISYQHVLGPPAIGKSLNTDPSVNGFYIVTAACDRLDMLASPEPVRDLRLSGQVISVGRSSMEVVVKMEALNADTSAETLLIGMSRT